MFWSGNLEWCGYPIVKIFEDIYMLVSTEYTNVTDRQPDGQKPGDSIGRAYRAAIKV